MYFLYPEGKKQALTFSFDDNQEYDKKLVEIFNKYGMKGTFNINSSTLDGTADQNWDGNVYIKKSEVNEVYKGHEVACHGLNHKFIAGLPDSMIITEFMEDRKNLEAITGKIINGAAYAFGWHDEKIMNMLKTMGFKYSRGVDDTNFFFPPQNFLDWKPTVHQESERLFELGDTFLNVPGFIELPIMYVWGHSFEFGRSGDWSRIEEFCKKMSGKESIWYATNMEICDYITATRSLEFSADGTKVFNPTIITLWLDDYGKTVELKPGETITIKL